MKRLFFISVLSISSVAYAQVFKDNISLQSGMFYEKKTPINKKDAVIDGTPYTTGKEFLKVTIPSYSKNVQSLRYNAYADEMEFSQNNETYYANKVEGIEITFSDLKKTYVCLVYNVDSNKKLGYLVLLKKGVKYSLYKREKVELLKGEKSSNAYSKDANDYYAKEKDIYLVSIDNKYYKLPKNIKDLTEIPFANPKNVMDFAKSNKINLNKEADLIKLVDFINQN